MAPYYTKFAIAGGSGNLGSKIAKELLSAGFSVVLLSRLVPTMLHSTKCLINSGATIKTVVYEDEDSLISALQDVQVVINTMSQETLATNLASDLVLAAKKAGVELVVPNDWGVDMDLVLERNDPPLHAFIAGKADHHRVIEKAGLSWLAFSNGLFGTFVPFLFGSDYSKHTANVPGHGNTPIVVTAEADVALAVAITFKQTTVRQVGNRSVQIAGQIISPMEIFVAAEAATGRKWQLTHVDLDPIEVVSRRCDPQGFFAWHQFAVHTGSVGLNRKRDIVDFDPQHQAVDGILGKL
ncbi:hypothetical protein CBS101457_006942 [Exobasidium rhododendri]|nr:hypothetical protein CBS101457_006942 [Exobasidium rhododendri]